MWPISDKTNIMHSLFISFILALNHLTWIPGLTDIMVTMNEILVQKLEQRCILKPDEHLR